MFFHNLLKMTSLIYAILFIVSRFELMRCFQVKLLARTFTSGHLVMQEEKSRMNNEMYNRKKAIIMFSLKRDDGLIKNEENESESKSKSKNLSSDEINRNSIHIVSLLENLSSALDEFILKGSMKAKINASNIMKQIKSESKNEELTKQAIRMIRRAGLSIEEESIPSYDSSVEKRKLDTQARKDWEKSYNEHVKDELIKNSTNNMVQFSKDKKLLQDELNEGVEAMNTANKDAFELAAELIAKAGAKNSFLGSKLGIGGLDDVLMQIKRRVWVPLAAPPYLLKELGIQPIRGLLLYGKPGCGKSLLARNLGNILSPARPMTM